MLNELESIQIELIEIQYQLDAGKRKPVPTIPIIYPEEVQKDPFEVLFHFIIVNNSDLLYFVFLINLLYYYIMYEYLD